MSSRPTSLPTGFELGGPAVPPGAPDKYDAPSLAAAQGSRRFHVMAKPAGSTCNLDCDYCFYLSKETLPGGPGTGRMSDEVLEQFIQQYIAGVTGDDVVFSWQGGEPTLMGLDFFRKVVALEKKYAKPGQRIDNDLQTNGTLLTAAWCQFPKKNNFMVGISLDGPKAIHNRYCHEKEVARQEWPVSGGRVISNPMVSELKQNERPKEAALDGEWRHPVAKTW
jgi:uncharacterized protein